jgi:hypothetical protein
MKAEQAKAGQGGGRTRIRKVWTGKFEAYQGVRGSGLESGIPGAQEGGGPLPLMRSSVKSFFSLPLIHKVSFRCKPSARALLYGYTVPLFLRTCCSSTVSTDEHLSQ